MNRNQRIVVSIVGIIIVTFALIGITYAYFLTKIIGNSTSTSISGTLANLELTYDDGNGLIATSEMMPGDTLEKTFSVQNTGSVKVENYAVIFENLTNTLTRKEDLVYTLTCESDDENPCDGVVDAIFPSTSGPIILNSIEPSVTHSYTLTVTYKNYDNIDQSADMGKKFEAKVNIKDLQVSNPYSNEKNSLAYKIINNSILSKNGTTYREKPLTKIGFKTASYSQISYSNVDIHDVHYGVSDYKTYAYSDKYTFDEYDGYILDNPKYASFDDIKRINPKYYAVATFESNNLFRTLYTFLDDSHLNVQTVKSSQGERSLAQTNDVYGTSYYYRGNVEDNYLTFNNMCWRIVRIQGDGSVKLILQDKSGPCRENINDSEAVIGTGTWGHSSGDFDYANCTSDNQTCMRNKFQSWYNTSGLSNYEDKLKKETWYFGANSGLVYESNAYDTYLRTQGYNKGRDAILTDKTNGVTDYVATLTADEVVLAGAEYETPHNYYYLPISNSWWTLSPAYNYYAIFVFKVDAALNVQDIRSEGPSIPIYKYYLRPSIVLKKGITVSGEGTKTNPYVVQ